MSRFIEEQTEKLRARNVAKGRAQGLAQVRGGMNASWKPRGWAYCLMSRFPAVKKRRE